MSSRRPTRYRYTGVAWAWPVLHTRDYLRFQRVLLGNGVLEGSKVLERETVDAAFTNQIGSWISRLRFPPLTPLRRILSTLARVTNGATGCCSTARMFPVCAGLGRAPGAECATRTSG